MRKKIYELRIMSRLSGIPQAAGNYETGFTLIEILIVISIIAVLVTVFVPNFLGARSRARDAVRKGDLEGIQSALELYKSDQVNPAYPASTFMIGLCNNCWSSGASCTGNVYMKKFPCDPQTGAVYTYTLNSSDNLRYTMTSCLENTQDPDRDSTNSCTSPKVSYTVVEP